MCPTYLTAKLSSPQDGRRPTWSFSSTNYILLVHLNGCWGCEIIYTEEKIKVVKQLLYTAMRMYYVYYSMCIERYVANNVCSPSWLVSASEWVLASVFLTSLTHSDMREWSGRLRNIEGENPDCWLFRADFSLARGERNPVLRLAPSLTDIVSSPLRLDSDPRLEF